MSLQAMQRPVAGQPCRVGSGSRASSRAACVVAAPLAARSALAGASLGAAARQRPVAAAARVAQPAVARMHGLAKYVSEVEAGQLKKDIIALKIGMTVKVGVTVVESGKSRVQPYQGLIIAMHKNSINSSVTVRKVFQGVGVERVFPIHSPLITIEEVPTAGVPRVRRAKLYYLRDRVGKAARLKQVFVSKEVNAAMKAEKAKAKALAIPEENARTSEPIPMPEPVAEAAPAAEAAAQ